MPELIGHGTNAPGSDACFNADIPPVSTLRPQARRAIACRACGTLQLAATIGTKQALHCAVCDTTLERRAGSSLDVAERVAQAAPATLGPLDTTSLAIDQRAMSRVAQAIGTREFPSADNNDGALDDIAGQVNQLLTKLNRFPIEAIGHDVWQAAASLNRVVSSPQWVESLQHLNQTLAQAAKMMTEVQPQVGPLLKKLDGAATELRSTVAAARARCARSPTTWAAIPNR